MTAALWVGLGGFLGAIFRYGFSIILPSQSFPYATFAVNILGCFCIGALATVIPSESQLKLFLITGLLGGFTTFSAFGFETFELTKTKPTLALANVGLHVFLGILFVYLGHWLIKAFK